MKDALLIFVKNPIKGKVKTRLAATLGDDTALEIYIKLLVHTEECTRDVSADKIVFYSDNILENDIWDNVNLKKQTQSGHDLGERMFNAFTYAFNQGYKKVSIIGSDCIELTPSIIDSAFAGLDKNDVAIGPALDGGYYLLALKSMHGDLFKKIEWSTELVLQQTMQVCEEQGLKVIQLPELSDIDNEADLIRTGLL